MFIQVLKREQEMRKANGFQLTDKEYTEYLEDLLKLLAIPKNSDKETIRSEIQKVSCLLKGKYTPYGIDKSRYRTFSFKGHGSVNIFVNFLIRG